MPTCETPILPTTSSTPQAACLAPRVAARAPSYDRTSGVAQLFGEWRRGQSVDLGLFGSTDDGRFASGLRPGGTTSYQGCWTSRTLYNRALTAAEVAAIYNTGPLARPGRPLYQHACSASGCRHQPGLYTGHRAVRGNCSHCVFDCRRRAGSGLTLSSTGRERNADETRAAFSFAVRALDKRQPNGYPAVLFAGLCAHASAARPGKLVRAETNALDSAGTNNGVLRNGAAFASGKAGQASLSMASASP